MNNSYTSQDNHLDSAKNLDQKEKINLRSEFHFPGNESKHETLYFCGHSLGLMPKDARKAIDTELNSWEKYGVEGHFNGPYPWLPYHENITKSFAHLVGAQENEVVAMNTLTTNLHLMLVSFYRPSQKRYKILIEKNTFPSDKYAVDSQARFHGFDAHDAIVELKTDVNDKVVSQEYLLEQIAELGDELALVMLGNCNYLSGQAFDIKAVTEKAHSVGAMCGFNLAHGAGNLALNLHDDGADFAVWCSYKYLNAGPGGIAGAFVHERHLGLKDIPRFEGWWGNNKDNRFEMRPEFDPLQTVEAWSLSNPPIFQLASLRASMNLFDQAGMKNLREKGDRLTAYLEYVLKENCGENLEIVTPSYHPEKQMRGSMLCVKIKNADTQAMFKKFQARGIIIDFREPDILRMCPAPLYNNFEDCYRLAQAIKESF
ncbi:MAG: kynureninase [Halobacteriovoraceae bacterium]|nr:kynureninase [Halobacteriovoraceae bacterium]|tara:strand:- start:3987 stop:5273 length:1287 start_codon:yes stop_codon:yes gene_type:complete